MSGDLELARALCREASEVAEAAFRSGPVGRPKADGTVVTDTDLAVEALLVAGLRNARPDDGIVGEEGTAEGPSCAKRSWITDPIDGTEFFTAGRADWGVHLALQVDGAVELGVVTRPALDRWWWAERGAGTFCGPISTDGAERVTVSVSERLVPERASSWIPQWRACGSGFEGWHQATDLDTMLKVVDGRLDGMVDLTESKVWDRAPYVVLLEEAGGRWSDLDGGRDLERPGCVLSNGAVHVHAALLEALRIPPDSPAPWQ